MPAIVRRFDRGELQKPVQLPNGWLKVDGYVGRTGLLEYVQADGSTWVEYRPPDEAFRDGTLASFDSVPLTNDHPPGGVLDANNTREYQVGTVQRPTQDGKYARASILITDASAIADVSAGKAELSMGYACELDLTPGVHEGRRYDCVQRNISGNHVALVDRARGGPEIRLRVDGHDSVAVGCKQLPGQRPTEGHKVLKIRIDGVEAEVSELAAQLIAKARKADADAVTAATAELEKANARADSAAADVKKLTAALAEAPAKARAAIENRLSLETRARKILGATEKLDGLSDLEVMRLAAAHSGAKVEGRSDAYAEAAFDLAVEKLDDVKPEPKTAPMPKGDGGESLEDARREFAADMRAAYLPKS